MVPEQLQQVEVSAWPTAQVRDFDAGSNDILVVERSLTLDLKLGRVPVREVRSVVHRQSIDSYIEAGLRTLEIPDGVLAADMSSVAQSFMAQFSVTRANLRIEVVDSCTCPKFHCDNVCVRLVTTYCGPPTEYRFVGESEIQQAPLYAFVFLKGHKHSRHRDSVHHLSPEVPKGKRRLCLIVDF